MMVLIVFHLIIHLLEMTKDIEKRSLHMVLEIHGCSVLTVRLVICGREMLAKTSGKKSILWYQEEIMVGPSVKEHIVLIHPLNIMMGTAVVR